MARLGYWQRKCFTLEVIEYYKEATTRQISNYMRMDIRQVRVILNRLIHQGLVGKRRLGGLNAYVYSLTEEGKQQLKDLKKLMGVEPQ